MSGQVLEPSDVLGRAPATGNREDRGTAASTTFLFTDVEGSTRLWELDQDGMQTALTAHDQILRDAIAARGGEVVKHLGDGLLAVFDTASNGVGAAVDAQRMLVEQPWELGEPLKVRMALHTGDATEARDGDYFGPVLNRCARLIGVAHGGQIIVSDATGRALEGDMLAGVSLIPLGQHRLRDLLRPEQVAQVTADGLPTEFPPLRSLDLWQGHLPLQMTSFVGRDDELAELSELVPIERVVTLVGPGGVGKTRLSLQVAADVLHRFADGAWFVDLASITDASLVVREIAAVVGARSEGGAGDMLAALVDHLVDRELLLVLDNCEQVLAASASAVLALRERCPGLNVLVTSQQPLRIEGERLWPLAPLPVRTAGQQPGEAVRLFVERAQAVVPRFSLDDDTAARGDRAVRASRWHPAGHRAGRGPVTGVAAGRAAGPSRRPVPTAARRPPRRHRPSPDAAQRGGLELRAAPGRRAGAVRPAVHLLGRVRSGCGRVARWRARPSTTPRPSTSSTSSTCSITWWPGRWSWPRRMAVAPGSACCRPCGSTASSSLTESGRRARVEERHAAYYGEVVRSTHGLLGGPDQRQALGRLDADLDNVRAAIGWCIAHDPDQRARRGQRAVAVLGHAQPRPRGPAVARGHRRPDRPGRAGRRGAVAR